LVRANRNAPQFGLKFIALQALPSEPKYTCTGIEGLRIRLETPPSSFSHLRIHWMAKASDPSDCRLAVKPPSDGAVTPGKKTRDLELPAWIQGFLIAGLRGGGHFPSARYSFELRTHYQQIPTPAEPRLARQST
jgi:hypothetical protein